VFGLCRLAVARSTAFNERGEKNLIAASCFGVAREMEGAVTNSEAGLSVSLMMMQIRDTSRMHGKTFMSRQSTQGERLRQRTLLSHVSMRCHRLIAKQQRHINEQQTMSRMLTESLILTEIDRAQVELSC
jgi:hypothetical protein